VFLQRVCDYQTVRSYNTEDHDMNFDGLKNLQYETSVFYTEKSDILQVKATCLNRMSLEDSSCLPMLL